MMSDESDDEEMDVEGPVPPTTPTTPRALVKPPKHDLMMTEEVTTNPFCPAMGCPLPGTCSLG